MVSDELSLSDDNWNISVSGRNYEVCDLYDGSDLDNESDEASDGEVMCKLVVYGMV